MKQLIFTSITLLSAFFSSHAQPATDIVIFDITYANGKVTLGKQTPITDRNGYDNQPHFSPDGKYLYYTSIQADNQADIYRYHLATGQNQRFTTTDTTSEYSPTVMPDGKNISVIMVEADGQTQRLWKFPIKGGAPKMIMHKIQPVGYHSWVTKKELVMFILGDPPTLQKAHIKKQTPEVLASKIGRSIHTIPGKNAASFVVKESEEEWIIYEWNRKTGEQQKIVQCLDGSEDYCWGPEGYIFMGQEESLYMFSPEKSVKWIKVQDLEIGAISRLAINKTGDKLAIVVNRK